MRSVHALNSLTLSCDVVERITDLHSAFGMHVGDTTLWRSMISCHVFEGHIDHAQET